MAQQDSINLIEEFTELQKDNDFIILTTFAFDPYFFDKYLYYKVRANNPNAEIIVLVDGVQYVKSQEKFTSGTGRHYHLIPIYPKNGVFHPKIFLFLSKNRKKSTLFIGSANLTMTGFTKNAEMISKIFSGDTAQINNFVTIRDFFGSLINDGFLLEMQAIKIFKNAFSFLPDKINKDENPSCIVIHNMKSAIIPEIIKEIENEKFPSATLLSPFFSNDSGLIEFINSNLDIGKFRIALQKNNHNLTNPQSIIDYLSRNGVNFEFVEAKFAEDDSRIIHSKILYLDGPKEYLLMGSANMTRHALLMNASQGNIECSVLFKDIQAASLINGIDLGVTTNFKDLVSSGKDIESKDDEMNILKIYSVDFDDLTRTLVILTEAMTQPAEVHVKMEGDNCPIDEICSLITGKLTLEKITKYTPVEVVIFCNGKIGNRRIYYDRGAFIRNISRSPGSLNQLFERLSFDFSLDTSDIHAIILGLSRPQTNDNDNSSNDQTDDHNSKKSHDRFSKPSKIHLVQNISSSIQRLNRAYQAVLNFHIQEYQLENEDPDGSVEQITEIKHDADQHPEASFNSELSNFIQLFNQLLLYRVSISIGLASNSLVSSQGIFIDMIVRVFPQNLGDKHISQIESILNENLKGAIKDNCENKTRIYLFKSLLSLNITYDLQMHYDFLNKLFHYKDFLDQDTYNEIKKFVQQSVENDKNLKREFDLEIFRDHFCSLICFVFTSKTIGEGPIEIVRNMKSATDEEYIDFLGTILLKLKNGAWDRHRGCFSIITPQKHIREDTVLLKGTSPKIKMYVNEFLK